MNYQKLKPQMTKQVFKLSSLQKKQVLKHREEIKAILDGRDQRRLIIIGPCSAWPNTAVCDYAHRLQSLQDKVNKKYKLVMRFYPQKSRTQLGWQGTLYQPDPLLPCDLSAGMKYTHEMMQYILNLNLPLASEIVNTHLPTAYWDAFSWLAIGARTTESQEHRIFASGLSIPVGFKNPRHGPIEIAMNSVLVGQNAHTSLLNNHIIETFGNSYSHLVLRGANQSPNFSIEHLSSIDTLMNQYHIKHPSIIIDVSHDNSIINGKKDYKTQPHNVLEIIENVKMHSRLNNLLKGFMIESFIDSGNQSISPNTELRGLSITDPCIDWTTTEDLLIRLMNQ